MSASTNTRTKAGLIAAVAAASLLAGCSSRDTNFAEKTAAAQAAAERAEQAADRAEKALAKIQKLEAPKVQDSGPQLEPEAPPRYGQPNDPTPVDPNPQPGQ